VLEPSSCAIWHTVPDRETSPAVRYDPRVSHSAASAVGAEPSLRERPEYVLGSVDNALKLIWLLRERGALRVSEAAEALETSRSTAYRLLAMLEYHRFAQQDPDTRIYAAGPGLLEVGLSVLGSIDIRAVARPSLERLVEDVEETVHLVMLHGSSVLFLDSVETPRSVRVGARVGNVMLAHCTASGKAILAQLTADQLHLLCPEGRLQQMTPRSLLTLRELEAELDVIRTRGYATNFGESETDVAAVAVAIGGQPGNRRASVTVSAPIGRLERDRVQEIAAAARRCAEEIERRSSAPATA
jgi:IclR family transcriptional regulator, acetate operon repressor